MDPELAAASLKVVTTRLGVVFVDVVGVVVIVDLECITRVIGRVLRRIRGSTGKTASDVCALARVGAFTLGPECLPVVCARRCLVMSMRELECTCLSEERARACACARAEGRSMTRMNYHYDHNAPSFRVRCSSRLILYSFSFKNQALRSTSGYRRIDVLQRKRRLHAEPRHNNDHNRGGNCNDGNVDDDKVNDDVSRDGGCGGGNRNDDNDDLPGPSDDSRLAGRH